MQKDAILEQILMVFDSQKEAADALGITEQNFSHSLKRGSKKFLRRLEKIGVDISPLINKKIRFGDVIENSNVGNKGNNYSVEVSSLKEQVKLQAELIESLREQIRLLKNEKGL